MSKRIRIAIAGVVIAVLATSVWLWATAGRETTDDAQVDAHVAPIAARVGGTVTEVPVKDNQQVEAGAVLVTFDPRDYQLSLIHISEPTRLLSISYAVFCLKKK